MILFNASQSNGLRNYTRFLTNTDTTTYANADLDAALNTYYHEVINEILSAMDGWDFKADTATADLVANQQEYALPTNILKIKRLEVSYDGTNWYKASFFDVNDRGDATSTTKIANDFSQSKPYADLMDNSFFLYPIPSSAVTAGLKIWFEEEQDELSTVTDEPSFPEAYHKILAYGAAKDWFEKYSQVEGNTNKRNLQQQNYNRMLEELKDYYNTKNQDRDYIVKPAFEQYDYGNE